MSIRTSLNLMLHDDAEGPEPLVGSGINPDNSQLIEVTAAEQTVTDVGHLSIQLVSASFYLRKTSFNRARQSKFTACNINFVICPKIR